MAFTDPARELVYTLEQLVDEKNAPLDRKIARVTGVSEWSADFFKVVFYLIERFDLLSKEILNLNLDDDIKEDALRSIDNMKQVFASKDMLAQNTNQIVSRITGANATVLKMLSSQVREGIRYHKIESHEKEDILKDVAELKAWLIELQSEEKDFIRQSLIDGLVEFEFRLSRLHWFGSGYPIESLKQVIQAYLALEGAGALSEDGRELSSAIIIKTRQLIKTVCRIVDLAKDNTDRADWILRAYGAVAAINDGSVAISGLISSTGGVS